MYNMQVGVGWLKIRISLWSDHRRLKFTTSNVVDGNGIVYSNSYSYSYIFFLFCL